MAKAQIIVTSCSRRGLELEQVRQYLQANGYTLSSYDWEVDSSADLILLSTCGFTRPAEDYGFETLRRVQTAKKPGARVVLGGCIPRINPQRVKQEFDGPTFSPQSYASLDQIIAADQPFDQFRRPNTFASQHRASAFIQDIHKAAANLKTFDGSLSGLSYISRRLGSGLRRKLIRAQFAHLNQQDTFYIQIQEGCSMHCSYCVIRLAIGPLRSRPIEEVMDDFMTGLRQGYTRFQLTGDNAGSYGVDLGTHIGKLLERLLEVKQDFVLDLTDINPIYLPLLVDPLLQLCREKKVSSLYVPIQSASRRILKHMRRDCDIQAAGQMLAAIKAAAPSGFRLGTSIIVGYPSETVDELEETIQFCRRAQFDWVWCHSFSARPETPAASQDGAVTPDEILRRSRRVKAELGSQSLVTTADDTTGSKTCQG